MTGLAPQNLPVELFRFSQASGLVMPQGKRELLGNAR
jgi:hypothetical protein